MKQALYFKLIQKYPFLSNFIKLNNGFLSEKESFNDYIFGASNVKKTILRPDGQWKHFIPVTEKQSGKLDSMACVSFSLLNVIETLNKAKWGEDKNYSDRFLAKNSNTTKKGNSMKKVIDSLRKKGVIKQDMWQNDFNSWNEFYRTIRIELLEMGMLWIKEYDLKYERVPDYKQTMIEALKYSPLWTSGFAWYKKDGLYRSYGRPNHAFTIVGYIENSHWIAFDTYDSFIKLLDWNFKFNGTKAIFLNKKSLKYNTSKIKNLKERGYIYIIRPEAQGEAYRLEVDKLVRVESKEFTEANFNEKIGITENLYNSLIR